MVEKKQFIESSIYVYVYISFVCSKNESEKIVTHMLSVLPQREAIAEMPSDWLFYEENTRANTLACVRTCTLVTPVTVAMFGGPTKLPPDALKDNLIVSLGKLVKDPNL